MQQETTNNGTRLAKAISALGYASRRDAEKIIQEGRVKVNGRIISDVITFVTSEDVIEVDHIKLFYQEPRMWIYHKPAGLVTTHKDPKNRPTVFQNLPIKLSHVISVGRLDIDSEGLLLITNSGETARKFELPSNNYSRKYKVKAYGRLRKEDIKFLEEGITLDGEKFKPCTIDHIKSNQSNHWFEVEIFEGKNREIRRMFESIEMQVNRLIRTSFHVYTLGDIPKGKVKEVDIIF
jgi:23S rRNA pseudouridine2605 synthase